MRGLRLSLLLLLCLGVVAWVSWDRVGRDRYASLRDEGITVARMLRSAAAEAAGRLEEAEHQLARRLETSARRIDEALIHWRHPRERVLEKIAHVDRISRLYLVDPNRGVLASARYPARVPTGGPSLIRPEDTRRMEVRDILQSVAEAMPPPGSCAVEGVRRNAFGTRERFGVVYGRADGTALLLRVNAEALHALRDRFGIRALLDRLRQQPGVRAVDVDQSSSHDDAPVAESFRVSEDALITTVPLVLENRTPIQIRVALATAFADHIVTRTRMWILLWACVAAALGLLGVAWTVVVQRRAALREVDLRDRVEEERRLADMGALAALVAHEIRNPLNSMQFALSLLEHAHDENVLQQTRRTLRAESQRMTDTLERFLGLARPRESLLGRSDPRVLDDVKRRTSVVARRADVRVRVRIDGPILEVPAHPLILEQALTNLVRNAISASPPGDVVTLHWYDEERVVCIDVRDNGPGFTQDLQRVFRVGASERPGGHGLGLPLARRFIMESGGSVRVVRSDSKGACVQIRFAPREEGA